MLQLFSQTCIISLRLKQLGISHSMPPHAVLILQALLDDSMVLYCYTSNFFYLLNLMTFRVLHFCWKLKLHSTIHLVLSVQTLCLQCFQFLPLHYMFSVIFHNFTTMYLWLLISGNCWNLLLFHSFWSLLIKWKPITEYIFYYNYFDEIIFDIPFFMCR